MPTRGYDEEAAKIGLNWGPHPRRAKLIVLAAFVLAVIVGASVTSWLVK
jgi:hypothetical protein